MYLRVSVLHDHNNNNNNDYPAFEDELYFWVHIRDM